MQIFVLFENIPGISFFVKDTNHRLLFMNQRFLPRIGLSTNDELYGKTDFDLFPPRLAEHFRRDDRAVMESKQPMLNILELVFNSQGLPDWYLTNKYPNEQAGASGGNHRDGSTLRRRTSGSCGSKWELMTKSGVRSFHSCNFRSNLEIADLVKVSGLNHRKLHRGS